MEKIEAYDLVASGNQMLRSFVTNRGGNHTHTGHTTRHYQLLESSAAAAGRSSDIVPSGSFRNGQRRRRNSRPKRSTMSTMRLPFASSSHASLLVPARKKKRL